MDAPQGSLTTSQSASFAVHFSTRTMKQRGNPEVQAARNHVLAMITSMDEAKRNTLLSLFMQVGWSLPADPMRIQEILTKDEELAAKANARDKKPMSQLRMYAQILKPELEMLWGVKYLKEEYKNYRSWGIIFSSCRSLIQEAVGEAYKSLLHDRGGMMKYKRPLYKSLTRGEAFSLAAFYLRNAKLALEYYALKEYTKGYKCAQNPYVENAKFRFYDGPALIIPDEEEVANKIRDHVSKIYSPVKSMTVTGDEEVAYYNSIIDVGLSIEEVLAIATVIKPSVYLLNLTSTIEGKFPKQGEMVRIIQLYQELAGVMKTIDPSVAINMQINDKRSLNTAFGIVVSNAHFILATARVQLKGGSRQLNGNEGREYIAISVKV